MKKVITVKSHRQGYTASLEEWGDDTACSGRTAQNALGDLMMVQAKNRTRNGQQLEIHLSAPLGDGIITVAPNGGAYLATLEGSSHVGCGETEEAAVGDLLLNCANVTGKRQDPAPGFEEVEIKVTADPFVELRPGAGLMGALSTV
jgi:hypothetical protein